MELPGKFLHQCGWLDAGDPDHDLVVSSRIRLARNFDGIPFSQWASSTDLKRIAEKAQTAIQHAGLMQNAHHLSMEELEETDRHFLNERYLISRELAKSGIERHVAIHPDEKIAIMINEEDHLRMQSLLAGSQLNQAWEIINALDNQLEDSLNYAFSNQLGYLTACPTNTGTGIRCSVMVHLPALMMTRKIEQVLNAVTQIGLTVRGMSGEGSEITGNLFQISNQWTLGISETETIQKIEKILSHIIEQERKVQYDLLEGKRVKVEDKVWRAYAALKYARIMSSSEAIEHLSALRLGRNLGIISSPSYQSMNEMMIMLRPAHLQKKAHQELSSKERDRFRADQLRQWIENGSVNFN